MLYYSKGESTDQVLRGVLDLSFSYISFEKDGKNSYKLKIQKNGRITSIYIFEEENKKIWEQKLSKICVQQNFHQTYKADNKIGSGAFGSVYKIRNAKGEVFAAKALPKKPKQKEKEKQKLLIKNEITSMRAVLGQPHFVQLKAIFETENSIYIVMEYIQGEPLMDLEEKMNPFKPEKRLKILQQLLEAQIILADLSIVHRDLKPDNVLLLEGNQIKIIDLGLACLFNTAIQVKKAGTPGFIAPEILASNKKRSVNYGAKTDIYSIGIIYYCMLYGEHPFDAEDAAGVYDKNKKGEIFLGHSQNAKKSEVDLLLSMLQKTAIDRKDGHHYLQSTLQVAKISKSEYSTESQNTQEKNSVLTLKDNINFTFQRTNISQNQDPDQIKDLDGKGDNEKNFANHKNSKR